MRTKKNRIAISVLAIVAILFFFLRSNFSPNVDAVSNAPAQDYPEHWAMLDLPQIPNADIASSIGDDIRQGVSFELVVNQPASEVGQYFEEEFDDRRYDYYEPDTSEGSYSNEFSSGDIEVTVDVFADPDNEAGSRVKVAIKKNHRSHTPAGYTSLRMD